MSELRIDTRGNQTSYRSGDVIEGAVGWQWDAEPEWVEVRLFWRTEGKGTQDVEVVETARFARPGREGAQPFRLRAPRFPCSFSGKLLSLVWALELVVAPGREGKRLDLVISPTGREFELDQIEGTR